MSSRAGVAVGALCGGTGVAAARAGAFTLPEETTARWLACAGHRFIEQFELPAAGGQHGICAWRWQCVAGMAQSSARSGVPAHNRHSASTIHNGRRRCARPITKESLSQVAIPRGDLAHTPVKRRPAVVARGFRRKP